MTMDSSDSRIDAHQELLNIPAIISEFNHGKFREFDRLMNQLKDPDITSHQLVAIFRSVDSVVMQIDRRFQSTLLPALLNLKWCYKEEFVVSEFKTFITSLLAVHNYHLPRVLDRLVRLFVPHMTSINDEVLISAEQRGSDNMVFSNVHTVLESIIHHVPHASKYLIDCLKHAFPSWKRNIYEIGCYVFNFMKIIKYVPSISPSLLDLFIDKIISIDSQLDFNQLREAFDSDGNLGNEKTQNVTSLMDPLCNVEESVLEFKSNSSLASKLDLLFWLLLRFIRNECYGPDNKLNWSNTKILYKQLLTIFDRKVLPLDTLCQVHFFMFYICSFHEDLSLGFIDYLWKRAQNDSLGYNLRQTTVWYLTDFLGRAKYITCDTLKSCIELMTKWCHVYIEQKQNKASNYQAHKVFYSVCQSVFFLCTYRHSELMEDSVNLSWCHKLGLQSLVYSIHNPLKYSEPNFVKIFSSVTKTYELAYCSSILEDNRQKNGFCSYYEASGDSDPIDHVALKFPFENYLLHLSNGEMLPLMREYSEGARQREVSALSTQCKEIPINLDTSVAMDCNMEDSFICGSQPKSDYLFGALSQFENSSSHKPKMDTLVFGDNFMVQ